MTTGGGGDVVSSFTSWATAFAAHADRNIWPLQPRTQNENGRFSFRFDPFATPSGMDVICPLQTAGVDIGWSFRIATGDAETRASAFSANQSSTAIDGSSVVTEVVKVATSAWRRLIQSTRLLGR